MLLASAQSTAQAWVAIGSAVAAAAGVVGSLIVGVREYTLKARAETAAADVRLAELFTRLTPMADARSGTYLLSEVAVQKLIDAGAEVGPDLNEAVLAAPVGEMTMAAAIAAVAELGSRHDVLKRPAQEALLGLAHLSDTQLARVYEEARRTVGLPPL